MNDVQSILVKLLTELDAECASSNVPYSIGKRLAWDALKFGQFHDRTYDAVVHVDAASIGVIAERLLQKEGRDLVVLDESHCCYVDTNTTLLDLNRLDYPEMVNVGVIIELLAAVGEGMQCIFDDGIAVVLPAQFLKSTHPIAFESVSLRISDYYDEYFSAFDAQWRDATWPYPINRYRFGVVFDEGISGARFADIARKEGLLTDQTKVDWCHFAEWEATTLKKAKQVVQRDDRDLGLWQERYRLWLKYYPQKEKLLHKHANGYAKAVELALDDYLRSLLEFYKAMRCSICFDADLFELAAGILEARGDASAAALRMAIPAGHYDSIEIPEPVEEQ